MVALELPPSPSAYPTRHMPPPPSSPHSSAMPPMHLASAPRGPPATSPFDSARDMGNHRPAMSLSNILDSREEHRPHEQPHNASNVTPSDSMRPPSPGRARSISMREAYTPRPFGESSPQRGSLFADRDRVRTTAELRGESFFGSPHYRREPLHSFRAYQPPTQDPPHVTNGQHSLPGRPSSQPADYAPLRPVESATPRDAQLESRLPLFRSFGESPRPNRNETQVSTLR